MFIKLSSGEDYTVTILCESCCGQFDIGGDPRWNIEYKYCPLCGAPLGAHDAVRQDEYDRQQHNS